MSEATRWIEHLALEQHPEGGWYKEVYRSTERIAAAGLPERFDGERSFCTSIYFLLESGSFSAFHRIKQDELWHFYDGEGLCVHVIDPVGNYRQQKLGRRPQQGESFQHVVNAGDWFAASVEEEDAYALVGCTVAPGFEFADFDMPSRDDLTLRFPQHQAMIARLTR